MKRISIILLFSILLITFYKLNFYETKLISQNSIIGKIVEVKDKYIVIKNKEKVIVFTDIKYEIGDTVLVNGEMVKPNTNSNFNLFNYQNYLKSKKIYWIIYSNDIKLIEKNKNIINKIKTKLHKKTNPYIKALVLGDTSYIEDDIKMSYQKNGISHLFSISGMHVTLITSFFFFLLNKIIRNKKINILIISIFLFFYMFITNYSVSIIRSALLFIIFNLVKIKKERLIVYLIGIFILYNPYYIYDVGFKFSFIISFYLINLKTKYKNYFKSLLLTSYISFLASIPILVNNYFEINISSIIINLFFVPFVSYIIFPISFITFFIPNRLFEYLIILLEKSSLLFNKINIIINVPKINIIIVIAYYILLLLFVRKSIKRSYVSIIIIIIYSAITSYKIYPELTFINVNQGDSTLLRFKDKNILIDTGGSNSDYIYKNMLYPYLKSIGVKKIDYLILTHGDSDHIGNAKYLINDIKVKKIILNSFNNNELENELIKNITYKNYSKNILKIDNIKLYFLNDVYEDENNDSLVIYTNINNNKILLLGDATKKEEIKIINEYNLKDLNILKVGHHGSKTSTSDKLINLNIDNAVISVGTNRYGHPNDEVLDKINDNKIKLYMTSINGTIKFILKDKLKVYTCHN